MVVLHNFREIFNESLQHKNITLPTMKQKFLKIDFVNTNVTLHNSNNNAIYNGQKPTMPFAESETFDTNICHWRRLTAESCDCKAVYEITLDITGSNYHFRPGDTIGVVPQNLDEEVDVIVDHLNLTSIIDLTYNISVNTGQKGAKIPPHVPVKSTLRHVLKYCVDLRGVLKKLFLLALSEYTKDETEKRTLEYLCSKEGSSVYTTHILKRNLCLLDLFIIFKTSQPPIEVILEHLPRLLPRPYSIVNNAVTNPNELKFCFSVMDIGNGRKGLVTGWIERIINNNTLDNLINNLSIADKKECTVINKITIYMRKNVNQFVFPKSCDYPMILIGPGTGVAPYIGFLEERQQLKGEKDLVLIWLFFGCRNPELDYIYEEDLKGFLATGILDKLTTAFSRMENCDNKYVQDALLHNGKEVAKLLKEGAQVYVCGNVRTLSAQVKEVLVKCLVDNGESLEEAERFMSDMAKDKRYLVDSWN